MRTRLVRCAVVWMGTIVVCGCSGAAQTGGPVAGPKQGDKPLTGAAAQASAESKFVDFSKEVEKFGTDEAVEAQHLQRELEEIVSLDKRSAPARFDLAVLEARAGNRQAAQKALEDILKDDADFAPAVENLTAERFTPNDMDKAAEIYQKIISKHPKNLTSRLALARILSEQQKYTQAIALCREVLQRQADAMEAFRVLAKSYHAVGNTPMAELIIGRGLKAAKDDPELRHVGAQILLDREDLAGGVAGLKHVVRLDPNRLTVRAQLADIALSYRDFGNAAQQYEAILKREPTLTTVQVNLAVSYKGLGRFDQAEKLYREILQREPDHTTALWNVGVLYHRHLNRYDDALASLTHFKSVAPSGDDKVGQVDALMAEISKLKNDQEAQRAREEHERKKREAVDAACAAVSAGKPADADAVGSEQERIEVAWQLMVNSQQVIQGGDVSTGEALVQCAFALVPNTPAANSGACAPMRVMWTQILYQLGRIDDAIKTIQDALKCDANNPDAQLIAQQLKELAAQAQPAAQEPAAPPPAPEPAPAKKKKKK